MWGQCARQATFELPWPVESFWAPQRLIITTGAGFTATRWIAQDEAEIAKVWSLLADRITPPIEKKQTKTAKQVYTTVLFLVLPTDGQ